MRAMGTMLGLISLGLAAGAMAAEVPAQVVEVRTAGPERIGAWPVKADPTLGAALRALGAPTSRRRVGDGVGCHVRWQGRGVFAIFANFGGLDACSPRGGRAQKATLTGSSWRTARGLRAGASRAALQRLYPKATPREGRFWLVSAYSPIEGGIAPVLAARMRDGRVSAFEVSIGAAGE